MHSIVFAQRPLTKPEYEALKADIQLNGVREPILTNAEGKIISGRHRYLVCDELGIEPKYQRLRADESVVDAVLSRECVRRHMSVSDKGLAAERLAQYWNAENAERLRAGLTDKQLGIQAIRQHLAQVLGIGVRVVDAAARVIRHAPSQVPAIEAGEKTVRGVDAQVAKAEKGRKRRVSPIGESSPKDSVGNALTSDQAAIFNQSERIVDLARRINAIYHEVSKLAEEPIGAHIDDDAPRDLKNAWMAVKWAMPYAVCKCAGVGCDACKRQGWVPKALYEQMKRYEPGVKP
jgi:hypothetical protein